ncbi:MAG: tRNA (adenosine(37)-N6)-threonylcarbamoyltransferase complex dimerization subunit type 1 TsaB, partial [Sphingobacteriales bacterium]
MALILQIDTASAVASVSVAKDGIVLLSAENKLVNEHAAFLQPAIQKIIKDAAVGLKDLDAVAVMNGPGSYTGLRVGLASAKGLAYALNKPLITIGTLPAMAHAAAAEEKNEAIFYAPMMDARRMEVFTAVYDCNGNEQLAPCAKVLDNDSFVALLLQNKLLFFGSGAAKFKNMGAHANALFSEDYSVVQSFAQLSFNAFETGKFAELVYSEPQYLKEFYT